MPNIEHDEFNFEKYKDVLIEFTRYVLGNRTEAMSGLGKDDKGYVIVVYSRNQIQLPESYKGLPVIFKKMGKVRPL